jgi:nicotinate-nucleotide adenylyltransferase
MVSLIRTQQEGKRFARRFAFLGGSFDPVHRAHLELMEAAHVQLDAQRVYAVPAKQSPLKSNQPLASDEDRVAMLRLAIKGRPEFSITDWELRNDSLKSYTLLTAEHFRKEFPDAGLWWIVGSDQFQQLAKWYEIGKLVNILNFAVYPRVGYSIQDPAISGLNWQVLRGPVFEFSSSEVRGLCQAGAFPEKALLPAVENYMKQHHLYKSVSLG